MDARKTDGRTNFNHDDDIERKLTHHFAKFNITQLEVAKNFPIYSRRGTLKKFLAHYLLFRETIHLAGDIIELGVFRGTTLMGWANFLEIHNMGDRQKQVFGFDNFAGFDAITEKDGIEVGANDKVEGGFDSSCFEEILGDAIDIFDSDRFVSYKPRVKLVKGDICDTVPKFVRDNPGLRLSLLHFDCDLYQPTLTALRCLWPLVVTGGVILFDEYGIRPWEGESRAVDEFFEEIGEKVKIRRFDWCPNPGGYLIK
jgi:hypothetical protein